MAKRKPGRGLRGRKISTKKGRAKYKKPGAARANPRGLRGMRGKSRG